MNSLSRNPFFAIIFLVAILIFPLSADAFQKQIDFKKLTWKEAEQASEQEDKFIFVDVHRGNVGEDVQKLKNEIYSDPDVVSYFNKHFINLKMDMSTEAGQDFAPKLQMLMYPTLVFFGPHEAQLQYGSIQKFEGPEGLLEMAKKAVQEGELLAAFNNSKINFLQKTPWDTLTAMAEEQNKPIMVDFYTTWCRPCIQMDRKVFTQDKVADLYNENFVVAKYDAEKGEGIELNKRYNIRGYPTYLFLDSDGEQLLRVEGYTEADSMIVHGKTALKKFDESSQSHSIDFEPADKSWADLKKQAAKHNKLIFMDAYAVWCGPCKQMDREVFTQKKVADYFNEHFINAKIDMEKGEGIELRKKYDIQAYPTYLYVDSSGEVVHRTVGSSSAEELIQNAENARSSNKNLAALKKQFQDHPGSIDAVQKYLKALTLAYKSEQVDKVVETYLSNQDQESLVEKQNWEIMQQYLDDASSPHFEYLADNRQKYFELYGKDAVQEKINEVFKRGMYSFISYDENGEASYDKQGFRKYARKIGKSGIENANEIIQYGKIFNHQQMKQWQQFADAIQKGIDEKIIDPSAMVLYNYALYVDQRCEDKEVLSRASEWAYLASKKSGVTESFKNYYWKLQAKLLEKAGENEKAAAIRTKIDEDKVQQAKDENPMKSLIIKG